jgi:hypothetical protein
MQEVVRFDWNIAVMTTDIFVPEILPSGDVARCDDRIPAGKERL